MRITEITEAPVSRNDIIAVMNDKKWPQALQDEMADEWVLKQPSEEGLSFVNGLDLQSAMPRTVLVQALLQKKMNLDSISRSPKEVVDRINQNWNLDVEFDATRQLDKNPDRYMKYMKMSAATAKPSIMVDDEIVMGVGRFIAALLRKDTQLKVWDLKKNPQSRL
jgi:hypothetical protein